MSFPSVPPPHYLNNLTLRQEVLDNQLWHMIRQRAKTDEGLRDLLDKTRMYYELVKERK